MPKSTREKIDVIDLIISVLKEHEKVLDGLSQQLEANIKNLEKISKAVGVPTGTTEASGTSDFLDDVASFLMKLPKGFNFEIPKIEHIAYVKITKVDSNASIREEKKSWETVFKDEE